MGLIFTTRIPGVPTVTPSPRLARCVRTMRAIERAHARREAQADAAFAALYAVGGVGVFSQQNEPLLVRVTRRGDTPEAVNVERWRVEFEFDPKRMGLVSAKAYERACAMAARRAWSAQHAVQTSSVRWSRVGKAFAGVVEASTDCRGAVVVRVSATEQYVFDSHRTEWGNDCLELAPQHRGAVIDVVVSA